MRDPNLPRRRTLRLPTYDYAGVGAYFLALVTHERECLFGEVVDLAMQLNELGEIAEREWLRSAEVRPGIVLDAFVVMPNHVHGIVVFPGDGLMNERNSGTKPRLERSAKSVGSFIAGFKSSVTTQINALRRSRKLCPGDLESRFRVVRLESAVRDQRACLEEPLNLRCHSCSEALHGRGVRQVDASQRAQECRYRRHGNSNGGEPSSGAQYH